tara:strand:+ start:1208 stop:1939 length:732 start_codon:yes stop_codon:yes gene_type:complete
MIITESKLRDIVRTEVIREMILNELNADIIRENFLNKVSNKMGRLGSIALITLAGYTSGCGVAQRSFDLAKKSFDGSVEDELNDIEKRVRSWEEIASWDVKDREMRKNLNILKSSVKSIDDSTKELSSSAKKAVKKAKEEKTRLEKEFAEQSKKESKNEFYILKGLKKINSRKFKQIVAAAKYESTIALMSGKYASMIASGDITIDQFEKAGEAVKHVSENRYSGEFLNSESIESYFKNTVGK